MPFISIEDLVVVLREILRRRWKEEHEHYRGEGVEWIVMLPITLSSFYTLVSRSTYIYNVHQHPPQDRANTSYRSILLQNAENIFSGNPLVKTSAT